VLDELEIERLIRAAGDDPATAVAVGVSSPSAKVLVSHRESADAVGLDCEGLAYAGSLAKQITGACAAWLAQDGTLPAAVLPQPLRSPAPLSVGDGGLWTSVLDLLRWNDALRADTLGVADTLHTTGALDDRTPLDYAWGVRVYHVGSNRDESHGGSWDDGQPSSFGYRTSA
jgi:hypothetical protein